LKNQRRSLPQALSWRAPAELAVDQTPAGVFHWFYLGGEWATLPFT